MIARVRTIVIAALLLLGGFHPALALDANPAEFERKLKQYDPQAVEAALAYARVFNFKEQFTKGIPLMRDGLSRQLIAKNPALKKEDIDAFLDAFFKSALVDKSDVIEKAILIIMLDIFSKDELIAVSKFYSSQVGQDVLKKMPMMMGKLPELQALMLNNIIIPDAMKSAQDTMKSRGVELKI
jgi:hypothetical protein